MEQRQALLIAAMTEYDQGDAMRIQHFLKVHDLAVVIGTLEHLDVATLSVLEAAAIVHDIGIHLSEQKYGSAAGVYQEKEGPAEAHRLLLQVGGFSPTEIERVCYLVGLHHTYTNIDGLDYQILVEADFLVNIYEDGFTQEAIANIRHKIFRTHSGQHLLDAMFHISDKDEINK